MTVLLPTDTADLYDPGQADDHGWAEPDTDATPVWTGRVSLQLGPGFTGVRAADEGGHGPFGPSSRELGSVYLPSDAPARDGMSLAARGSVFALSAVRLVADPTGGYADCVVAQVSQVDTWPA